MNDIFHSLSDFYAADHAASTPTTDAAPTTQDADPFADLRAAVAEDADWREDAHPRNQKGGAGGGRFRTSGKTIEREDALNWFGEADDKKVDVPDEVIASLGKTDVVNENLDLLKRAASSKHTDEKILDKLAHTESYASSNANCEIQEAVSDNPSTGTETLKFLAGWPTQNEDAIERESDHKTAKRYNTSAVSRNARRQLGERGVKGYGTSYDAAINWQEMAHPRATAGSGHGGEFTIKPETISREDSHDAPAAIGASLERGLVDIVKAAGPHGTSAKADVFKEFGKPVAAIRLVKNDRERFSSAEMKAMIEALQRSGCSDVEEVRDSDRPHETAIFCTPPVDPGTAAAEYMAEVEKSVGGSKGSFTPSDEAKESAALMAKNVDDKNPAKRIKVDFQEWTLESAQREEPSATGTEEDETDGKEFASPEAAAKWLLDTKNAGALEGDDAWYSSVSGKDGKWKTYRLTPVNFTEQEILDIERIVSKGKKED